ncbi:DUF2087 domain-containing protein [Devriesea agamarum]|uniref:DUF2087 domain-containing protein n=1 Tax=Devriesea agamarum TaxID=472569 RepID=UPI00071CF340|nr:DUF2087 domain-containing protein [Devriesea agamarum]
MGTALNSDDADAVKRARMIVSALATPKLRDQLCRQLTAQDSNNQESVSGPRYDWLQDGHVDIALLRTTADRLKGLLEDDLIIRVGRREQLPSSEKERVEASQEIIREVFARVGAQRAMSEAELNAAVAMFTPDVAVVRRDGVDSGLLARTHDGAKYSLLRAL